MRYENCQACFEKEVSSLASLCDVELTPSQIDAMKERLLNKRISPMHARYIWQPEQNSKWRRYLGSRHLAILAEEGMRDILDILGYATTSLLENPGRPKEVMSAKRDPTPMGPIMGPGFFLHIAGGSYNDLGELFRLGLVYSRPSEDLLLESNDPITLDAFETFVKETDFMNIISAGSILN